jgi:hypothetical protein
MSVDFEQSLYQAVCDVFAIKKNDQNSPVGFAMSCYPSVENLSPDCHEE